MNIKLSQYKKKTESKKVESVKEYNTIPEIKERLKEINKQLSYIKRRDAVSLSIGTEEEQEELYSERAKLNGKLRKLRNDAVNMDKLNPSDQAKLKDRLKDLHLWDGKDDTLQSALQSYRNHYIQQFEDKKIDHNIDSYKSGDVVDILGSYGKWLNSSDRIKYVIDRPATKEEIEGIWDIDTPCYIVKTVGMTDDTKFLNGTSKEPITRLRHTIYKSKEHKINENDGRNYVLILELNKDVNNRELVYVTDTDNKADVNELRGNKIDGYKILGAYFEEEYDGDAKQYVNEFKNDNDFKFVYKPLSYIKSNLQKSDKMNEASIDDNASILEGLVNFLNDNNITADNIDKNKDLVEKYLSDNKLGISAYIPTIYKVAKDDYGTIGRIIFYRSKNEWGFNTSSIVIESNKINESYYIKLFNKDGTDIDTIETSTEQEAIKTAEEKMKEGWRAVVYNADNKEALYDYDPSANLNDYITSKTESNNNTYYYDIHIVEDEATGMGYSVFIKTTKHYDEDLDADAIVDEAIKQNKLDADEADYCDYVSEISEQEYKDAAPHTENELVNVGDKFINQNGAMITILEPTKNNEVQFKVTNTKTGEEGTDVYITSSIDKILKDNGYTKIEERINNYDYIIYRPRLTKSPIYVKNYSTETEDKNEAITFPTKSEAEEYRDNLELSYKEQYKIGVKNLDENKEIKTESKKDSDLKSQYYDFLKQEIKKYCKNGTCKIKADKANTGYPEDNLYISIKEDVEKIADEKLKQYILSEIEENDFWGDMYVCGYKDTKTESKEGYQDKCCMCGTSNLNGCYSVLDEEGNVGSVCVDCGKKYSLPEIEKKINSDMKSESKVNLKEDQYEYNRRKGRPNIKKIAETEYYDNQEWYDKNINKYEDMQDFIYEEVAGIAHEYNLKEKAATEVCELVYLMAMKRI